MAKYDHKGTKITGTSTTAKKFPKSKVSKAKKGDTYFNTEKGHVYKCTEGGAPKDAKWKYIRTDIAEKPEDAALYLSQPTRQSGNRIMKATWKTPSSWTNEKNGDRAEGLKFKWWFGGSGLNSVEYDKNTESLTSATINLNSLKIGNTTYTRNSFYPITKRKLTSVTFQVRPVNSKGKGSPAKTTRNFLPPRAPVISTPEYDANTGTVSATITTNEGADHYERLNTRYRITVLNTRISKKPYVYKDEVTSDTSKTVAFDAADYQQLDPDNDYIMVKFEAWARGFAGDTAATPKTYYVSYPKQATIQGVDISGNTSADRCTVRIKTNHTADHPVDQVRLEYLANVTYSEASAIPGDANWTSTEIVDNASCTALTMPVGDLIPDKGHYTWVRVKSYHAAENVLVRYSDYWHLEALEHPDVTAEDDLIAIVDNYPGTDGQSIVVQLGWDADGQDDATGTELTWADAEDAWKSTKEPDSHEFSWEDTTDEGASIPVTYEGVTYRRSATITIKGLNEGEKYYIRARRYYEGDTTSYSPYSNMVARITNEIPETVNASCQRYVPTGSSLQVNWTLAGNGLQREWQIIDSNGTVLAEGEGSLGTAQISAKKLASVAVDGSVTFKVYASTGSKPIDSEEHTVTILDNPTLAVSVPATLTAQPFSFTATASTPSDLIVIVSSQGAVGQFPDGIKRQTSGDTIYSDVIAPVWENGSATIEVPSGLDFWDGGHYTVEVTAVDRDTGLRSETQTASFEIAWAHQAPSIVPITTYSLTADTEVVEDKAYYTYDSETQTYTDVTPEGDEDPSDEGWYEVTVTEYVTLAPINETDENGVHHQAVQITLTPPSGSASSDVYDIYRKVGNEAYLIGEGFPLTHVTTDEYAPFGDTTLEYRVAVRTADGDISFSDIEYVLEGTAMRFDWANGSLELPYNLSIADSYSKDVDIRKHMDGSVDGYWNRSVERTGSLASDVIRLEQEDEINMARSLARYTGPVFVRTPDGSAYEADVQVSDMSTEGVLTAIAIDATEVGLTTEFILPTPFTEE